MKSRIPSVLLTFSLMTSLASAVQVSQPSDDAWPLYAKAIQRVQEGYQKGINSPAASSLVYPEYPPYPQEWTNLENEAYKFNAPARALAREARSRSKTNWPTPPPVNGKPDFTYLNGCRALANDVADAALEQHLRGDETAAIESVRDLLHLADLLEAGKSTSIIRQLVAVGIRMIAVQRLEIITSDVALTKDPADTKRLQIASAKELIRQLFRAGEIGRAHV